MCFLQTEKKKNNIKRDEYLEKVFYGNFLFDLKWVINEQNTRFLPLLVLTL